MNLQDVIPFAFGGIAISIGFLVADKFCRFVNPPKPLEDAVGFIPFFFVWCAVMWVSAKITGHGLSQVGVPFIVGSFVFIFARIIWKIARD